MPARISTGVPAAGAGSGRTWPLEGVPPNPRGQARPGHACPQQEAAGFPETSGNMCSFTQKSSAAGQPACPSRGLLAHSPSSLSAMTLPSLVSR